MTGNPEIAVPETVDELVHHFVKLRDRLKEADDAHKKRTAAAREHLNVLGNTLLDKLASIGGDSVKTPHGTAYKTTRRSATIADGELFRNFVVANGAFDLLDWKANANAVDDFIKTNKALPPGVNYNTAVVIGVRRA